jgi:phosphoethanolamine N-methyltransferase
MPELTPEHFDGTQYTKSEIAKYEAIYGRNFISPGGERTSAEFIARLGLERGMRVLDVGCGIGGCAFQMAAEYGADVDGIDISRNMIEIGRERCAQEGLDGHVRLLHGDILEMEPGARYHAVHGRDVFLHIHDKDRLFSCVRRLLLPEGLMAFTDYCRGEGPSDGEFDAYVEQRHYCLHTLAEYERLLRKAGFVEVRAEDRTRQFVEIHRREIEDLPRAALDADDADDLIEGWTAKIRRARSGIQCWGWFEARRAGFLGRR